MGIRLFKHALAIVVSLSAATPGWAAGEEYGEYLGQVQACHTAFSWVRNKCDRGIVAGMGSAAQVGTGAQAQSDSILNASGAGAVQSGSTASVSFAGAGACYNEYNDKCKKECNFQKLGDPPAEEPKLGQYNAAVTELKKRLSEDPENNSCYDYAFNAGAIMESGARTAAAGKKGMGDIWKYAAAAGVGAGAMYLLKGDGKKKDEESDEEKKAKAAKAANGVIKDSAGNEITCFSPEQVTNPTCKSTLLSMCQGEKANTAGCRSFEAGYCAGEGNGSNYCLYAETKVYCAQSGDMIASSPACAWKSSRPASCTTDPEAVTCLAQGTPEALTLSCGNFPNDPLCKANSAGRVVVQGGGSAPASGTVAGTDNPTNPGTTTGSTTAPIGYASNGSVSMSSVIGGARTAPTASTLAVISSNESIWSAPGSAVKKACAAGQLLNCL